MSNYNLKNPAIKRLLTELKEFQVDPSDQFVAQPLEDNLFEWHFSIRGPQGSDFDGGIYHGRIIFPPEYPMKPPDMVMLTPSGRWETGKKICLTISAYHPESWNPSWNIRSMLIAIIGFMPTPGNGAVAALDYTPEERKSLAKKSHNWKCNICNSDNAEVLKALSAIIPKTPSATTTVTTTSTVSPPPLLPEKDSKPTPGEASNPNNSAVVPANPAVSEKEKLDVNSLSSTSPSPSPSLQAVGQTANTAQTQVQQQQVLAPQSGSSGADYLIIAILIALLSVLLHKFYKS